MYVVTGS